MESSSRGKAICTTEGLPNKPIPEMAPPKLSLGGKNSSTSIAASNATIDLTNSAKTVQEQAPRPNLGPNCDPYMDPKKLRRIMSNRLSAQRSRMKKVQYVAGLEMQAKDFETHIAEIQPQLISYQNEKERLILEQQALDLQVETLEEITQVKNAEIERNQAELTMLRELYRMQEEQLVAHMYSWDTSFQPMPTDLQPMSYDPIPAYYPDSNQVAQNGEGASFMNIDMPQNQSQIWMPAMPDENQNMTQLGVDEMDTNLMNNNAWNPYNHGNGFN